MENNNKQTKRTRTRRQPKNKKQKQGKPKGAKLGVTIDIPRPKTQFTIQELVKMVSQKKKVKTQQASVSDLHPAAQKLALAYQAPFHIGCKGAHLPNMHARPSMKSAPISRGTIAMSTATEQVYILLHPNLANDAPSASVFVRDPAVAVNAIDTYETTLNLTLDTMYSGSEIAANDVSGRASVFGVRVEWTGTAGNRGGQINFLTLQDNLPLIYSSAQSDYAPLNENSTFGTVGDYVTNSKLTIASDFADKADFEFCLAAHQDTRWSPNSSAIDTFPSFRPSESAIGGYRDNMAMGVASPFLIHGGVYGIVVLKPGQSTGRFRVSIIQHMETHAPSTSSFHTPSPSAIVDTSTVHSAIKSAISSFAGQDQDHASHVHSNLMTEIRAAGTSKGGKIIEAQMAKAAKNPNTYEQIGLGLAKFLL